MAAHYDFYDYSSYWEGRGYEQASEEIAIGSLLARIPEVETLCEIGAGFGRLIPTYIFRAKKIIVTDPSLKLLSTAKRQYQEKKNIEFLQSTLENLPNRLKEKSLDLIILVRVLHHIRNLDTALETITKLLKNDGFLILEFANKAHFKATISELAHGNLTFPIDISPKDIRSEKSIRKKTLPFLNYHPDTIKESLEAKGFKIIKKLSVSNIRSPLAKRLFATNTLVCLEKYLQVPLSYINFGPSIFILAKLSET